MLTAAAATLALAARLQCPRCSSALVAPRSFPCNHSFCSECAEESVNDSNGCSVCHRPFHVRDARDNHMLLALVALSVELSGKANELTHAGIEATRLGRERAALLRRAQAAASGGEGEGGGARAHLPEESPPKVGRASDAADVAATRDRKSSHVAAGTGGAAAPAVTAAKAAAPRGAAPAASAPAPPPTAASSGASVTSPSGAPPAITHAQASSLEAPARSPPAAAPTAAPAAAPPPPALPRSAPPPPPHRLSGAALAVHGPRILCGTSLDAAYRERLVRVGALVQGSGGNGGGTTDEFDPTRVTHLITRTTTPAPGRRVSELVTEMLHPQAPRAKSTSSDTDTTPLVCKRTLKYVQAVLCGCWVLSAEWLDACLEAGRVVDEGPFELTGDWGNPLTLAPKRGREAAAAGCVQTLFAGLAVRIFEPLDLTSRQEMALLVRCGGGTLVVDGVGGGAGVGGAGVGEGEKAGEVSTVGTIGSLESSWASCGGLPARDRMLRDAAATGLRVLSQQFFLDSASHMELREPGAYELRAPPPPEGTAKGKATATRRGERLG